MGRLVDPCATLSPVTPRWPRQKVAERLEGCGDRNFLLLYLVPKPGGSPDPALAKVGVLLIDTCPYKPFDLSDGQPRMFEPFYLPETPRGTLASSTTCTTIPLTPQMPSAATPMMMASTF
jgi:hypothetical protein